VAERDPTQRPNLPAGTQVVTLADVQGADGRRHPRGSVAVVVRSPDEQARGCRVRFLDGQEVEVHAQELDLVTHDLKKFIGLMLKKNGYVLEQL
jgi:hypothetical protein